MDLTLVAYTASIFAALLSMSVYSHWGVPEVHAYTIPPALEYRGYTPRIVANQVADSIRQIQVAVSSLDEIDAVVEGDIKPVSEAASYFGIKDLLRATEYTLGLAPNMVEIEITQKQGLAHWRLRGDHALRGRKVVQGETPIDDPDKLIAEIGLQVVTFVSPFEALAYHFIKDSAANDYEKTIAVASELLLDCERSKAWVCTKAHIKNAYLLRGMAFLGSDRSARAFDDLDSANKIGAASALNAAFYGDAFAALGHEDAAKTQYERANQLDPEIGERFYELARGYAHGENFRLADRRYTTAADLGVVSEDFLADWADTLFVLGWYKAALEKYRAAEAVDAETDLYADRIDRTLKAIEDTETVKPQDAPPPPPTPAVKGEGG